MKKFDEINIIPFIDIMLVLLAIVLITASFISQGKIQVDVPKAQNAVKLKADDLAKLLTITEKGDIYFNDQPISVDDLEKTMADWSPDQKITVKVDARSPFQGFVTVTDLISKFGFKNIAIVTQKKESAAPQAAVGATQ